MRKEKSKSVQDDIVDSAIDEAADLIGLDEDTKDFIKEAAENTDASSQQPVEADIEIIVDLPEGWEEKSGRKHNKGIRKGTTMVTIMKPWVPSGVNDQRVSPRLKRKYWLNHLKAPRSPTLKILALAVLMAPVWI